MKISREFEFTEKEEVMDQGNVKEEIREEVKETPKTTENQKEMVKNKVSNYTFIL